MSLRIAVVGLGYWGPNLVRNVAALPGAELWGVCDRDTDRLDRIRSQYAPKVASTRLEEVLAADCQAVILATPSETHFEIGMRVLEAGKHLLVEKPLALTGRDGEAMVAAADSANLVLMVGHTFEHNAAVRKVRELIHNGDLGEIYYLYSQRLNLGQVRSTSNAMWNLAPHDVSIANFLLEEAPTWVQASGFGFLEKEVEDVVFMTVGYPGDRLAHIHVSWLDPNKVRKTTVVGSSKMVVYDEMSTDARVQVFDKGVSRVAVPGAGLEAPPFGEFQFQTRTGDVWIPKIEAREPLAEEVAHFVSCVRSGSRPLSDGRRGLAVVRVLEAAQQSIAAAGAIVPLQVEPWTSRPETEGPEAR